MRVVRYVMVFIALVCSLSLVTVSLATAQSKEAPKGTEVGVSAKEVHIAVVADSDNPIAPGLFQGAVNAAKGAATYLNSKAGGGGIGGRRIVVDFIDSHLNANDTRNAIISACSDDFALVATTVIFLASTADQLACKDQAGAATGIPDVPSFVTGVAQSCSPITFPVSGVPLDCATKDQSPQTYRGNKGPQLFLQKKFGKLHGVYIYSNDSKDATRATLAIVNTDVQSGIAADQKVARSGRDPQSAYTSTVTQMKADKSNFATGIGTQLAVPFAAEAQLQGVTGVVWSCSTCYSKELAKNPVLEGTWVDSNYIPFEEANTNATVKAFVKYVKNPDQYAVPGWTATLAFADAARAVVAKRGLNGLTRASFLKDGIPTLDKFDAGGMIGTIDIPSKVPSHCYVMMHLQSGKYVRVHPTKKGTFDCSPKNASVTKADLLGQ